MGCDDYGDTTTGTGAYWKYQRRTEQDDDWAKSADANEDRALAQADGNNPVEASAYALIAISQRLAQLDARLEDPEGKRAVARIPDEDAADLAYIFREAHVRGDYEHYARQVVQSGWHKDR